LQDAAAGCGDRLVVDAQGTSLLIVEPRGTEDAVRVAIDESGE